jgi:hypothetical protein
MRAAIQISGEFRCLHLSLQSFQTHILDPLQARGYTEIYIFCHCWKKDTTELGTFPFDGRGDWHTTIPVFSTQEGLSLFKPFSYFFEDYDSVDFLKGRSRVLSMYYSIWMANRIRQAVEDEYKIQFDLVIRYRTDLILESSLFDNMPTESSFLVIPKSTLVKTCDGPFESSDESHICDYLAYGTPDVMNVYGSVFETWFPIPETPIGESCLAIHLKKSGIKAKRTPVAFYLVEGDGKKRGVVYETDFTVIENPPVE